MHVMITLTEHFLYVWAQPVNGLQQITRTLFPIEFFCVEIVER